MYIKSQPYFLEYINKTIVTLVGLAQNFASPQFGLVGLVWFGRFGLIGLVW